MRRIWAPVCLTLALTAACSGGSGKSSSSATVTGPGNGGAGDNYCKEARDAKRLGPAFSGLGSSPDPGSLKKAFDTALPEVHRLDGAAPPEIKADWDTLTGVFDKLDQALGSVNGSDRNGLLAIASSMRADAQKLPAVGRRISDYTKAHCGIELGSPGRAGSGGAGAPDTSSSSTSTSSSSSTSAPRSATQLDKTPPTSSGSDTSTTG
ncbi:MAG: hypothetical protein ACYDAD_01485 [Acidimicrobiales bacterium]